MLQFPPLPGHLENVGKCSIPIGGVVMPKMIVRHKVKDFDTWKKVFDSHKGAQTAAGLTNPRIFRSADDPNETVVIFDAQDIARAKAFGASADLKSTMVASGLVDKPDVYFDN
jgi:hypothetical protein